MLEGVNIEIGARTDPIIDELDTKFTQGRKAILVDKRLWGDRPENFQYVQADSQALPFTKDTVELLVSKDMFCAQGFLTSEPNWTSSIENVGNFETIAQEWFRVAKPGALAIIIETATPHKELFGKLDNVFSHAGFVRKPEELFQNSQISKLFKNDSSWSKEKKYQTPNSFAVIYHKP